MTLYKTSAGYRHYLIFIPSPRVGWIFVGLTIVFVKMNPFQFFKHLQGCLHGDKKKSKKIKNKKRGRVDIYVMGVELATGMVGITIPVHMMFP